MFFIDSPITLGAYLNVRQLAGKSKFATLFAKSDALKSAYFACAVSILSAKAEKTPAKR